MKMRSALKKVFYAAVLFSCSELSAVVCEMPDSSFLDLGEFVGANAFYERGVYGQGVNVANIELEVASKEDEESYGKYAVFLKDSVYTTYVPNYEIPSFHAYATLAIMAGNNKSYKDQKAATGLANMANYVSGQLKDGIRASNKDVVKVYETFFSNGTDVISSSWKDSGDSSYMAGVVLDSYAAKGVNTVFVAAAANDGESGAGALNASEALSQYDGFGTTSFLGNIGSGESSFYEFYAGESGAVLGATLCWMLGSTVNDIVYDSFEEITSIDASSSYFANLDLRLWYADGSEDILIAQSVSEYNNVEHLFLELTKVGNYKLEVFFKDLVYGNSAGETYGIAWNLASIPEPSEYAAVIGITAILIAAFRRKKQ